MNNSEKMSENVKVEQNQQIESTFRVENLNVESSSVNNDSFDSANTTSNRKSPEEDDVIETFMTRLTRFRRTRNLQVRSSSCSNNISRRQAGPCTTPTALLLRLLRLLTLSSVSLRRHMAPRLSMPMDQTSISRGSLGSSAARTLALTRRRR